MLLKSACSIIHIKQKYACKLESGENCANWRVRVRCAVSVRVRVPMHKMWESSKYRLRSGTPSIRNAFDQELLASIPCAVNQQGLQCGVNSADSRHTHYAQSKQSRLVPHGPHLVLYWRPGPSGHNAATPQDRPKD